MSNTKLLDGRFALLSGSISRATDDATVKKAHEFVQALVTEVINQGGGFVVYVASEPVSDSELPLVFDWTVAKTIDRLIPSESGKLSLKIVASQLRLKTKATPEQRALLNGMVARGIAEYVSLDDDIVTGGTVREEQVEIADMMIALGGGKGALATAKKMTAASIPVFPIDLNLGALNEDGDGAIAIHKAFLTSPLTYFQHTGQQVAKVLPSLTLQEPAMEIGQIAQRIVRLFHEQEQARVASLPPDVLVLTALDVELAAAKLAFGIAEDTASTITPTGYHVWKAPIIQRSGNVARCAIVCFAAAGNNEAAAVTATLLGELKPSHVMMLGIAAGMRDKCALGEVVLVERVVAYEGAAVVAGGELEHRPEITRLNKRYRQDVATYLSSPQSLESRLSDAYKNMGIVFPDDVEAGRVSKTVKPRNATIGSGEKLLRNAATFMALRELHGKTEVAEMEAAGLFAACEANDKPVFMVRGISDFGDDKKDNRFHQLAAQAAAAVTADFIAYGLTIESK